MANNKSRISSSSPSSHPTSKLPKFLQKQGRDRSKSLVDPSASANASSSTIASSSSSSSNQIQALVPAARSASKIPTKRVPSAKELDARRWEPTDAEPPEDAPVIIEPVPIPRTRTRSERPLSDIHPLNQVSSNPRFSDLPTRLSGWFSHTFSASSTDLSLPAILSQSSLPSVGSPKGKGSSALLTVARNGKGHLDKAMRYLLDSDAMPDRCPDPIWILGLNHAGYEPPPSQFSTFSSPSKPGSPDSRNSHSSPPSSYRPYQDSTSFSSSQSSLSSSASNKNPSANWPPIFYEDFTSRIWLTYRSHFSPIRDTTLSSLSAEVVNGAIVSGSPGSKKWFGLAEKGWTSDAGWGCMLRTGQSLLANTLLHLHLGRGWRRPQYPQHTADYATYVKLLTWFMDSPSPLCPFSVHRMALAGKDLGKDVGQWFGPSTAAGAIRALVHAFPEASLGVAVAEDSVIYQGDVYAASNGSMVSPRRPAKLSWGSKGVLVLIGNRLGIEGVNPIYYGIIKELYTFPQSVGIAGGRPSSSYFFVGSQSDNLFYLDPHHSRPAVPLRPPPSQDDELFAGSPNSSFGLDLSRRRSAMHARSSTSPRSSASGRRSTLPFQNPPASSSPSHMRWQTEMDERELGLQGSADDDEMLDPLQEFYVSAYSAAELRTFHCDRVRKMPLNALDPSMLIGFFCRDEKDWKDLRRRVEAASKKHKSVFSIQDERPTWPSDSNSDLGLESISDPELDMDEPEDFEDEFSFEGDVDVDRRENSSRSSSPSTSLQGGSGGGSRRGKSSEIDTEEDPIGPITPHAGTFNERGIDIGIAKGKEKDGGFDDEDELMVDDDDDDWVDPVSPEALPAPSRLSAQSSVSVLPATTTTTTTTATATATTTSRGDNKEGRDNGIVKKKKKRSKTAAKEVPIIDESAAVSQHFPFPSSTNDELSDDQRGGGIANRSGSVGKRIPQMRTTKARDGGRTQSGGVKGVLLVVDGEGGDDS